MRKYIDLIANKLSALKVDFYMHIIAVLIISTVIARVTILTGANHYLGTSLGVFIGLLAGIGKEIYDNKTTGVFSTKDIIADVIGILLFIFVFI